ncbi:mucin-12 isoform X1 [Folsomia candida]|uniref:mucin-12 isoform X1 n=1 Tax=Folsomia candida TaxID=158441 RepID=UPI000B8FEE8F|nr:mucin-12 isoform X1 [Folsomia candida]
MVLRDQKDPLNTSRGIMGPLENSAGVQNNRGRLKQRFDLIRKLGQGTYGKVQLGIDKETGQEVAIKTIKKSKIETEADLIRIRREIQIMSSVRHPNIIHIYEVFENREKMVLVMEYAAGGELYDYLNERKILQEDEARRIFRQIASAVYYCHKNKICHRDLKLENILLDEKSNAKIADFGLSNVFDDVNMLKTFCGSPLYASPEIVKGTPYSGPEVDCWSLGVLLYTLVYGAMPFDGSNFKRLVKQISAGDYYEPKKPAEASPLIRIMLTVDPKKRAKVEDICAHVWINHGFDQDCLHSAEELAKQTPVRLDVLLTLAPNMNNHAGAASSEAGAGETNHKKLNESDSAVAEPPKKAKMQGGDATGQKDGVSVPQKPKRKTQSKTKSKTTPLMLDLIQDVVEEENEDVDMSATQPQAVVPKMAQAHPVAGASSATKGKPPSDDKDDDECDTLSEISEIQTIAEDLDNISKKKERVKSVKGKAAPAPTEKPKVVPPSPPEHESRPKQAKQTATTNSQPPVSTPKLQKTETPEVPKKTVPEPEVVTPAPPKPAVVKKKIVNKPKATSPAPQATTSTTPQENKVTPEPKPVAPPSEPPPPPTSTPTKTVPQPEVAQPEVKPVPPPPSTSDKDKTPEATDPKEKKTLVRQRSGSVSDVSPTRVERRNSKIISQKTAELIQNLETKTSSTGSGRDSGSSSGGEGSGTGSSKPHPTVKKLVIPNFKVSDAKNKFETKPPRPITSSIMSQSKAAFEAKAAASQSTPASPPVKPTPPPVEKAKEKVAIIPAATVAKSPSPVPKEDKQLVAPPEQKEQVSPKMKPKVVKKPETSPKVSTAPVAKSITPEPPTISEATVTTVAPTPPVAEPEIVEKAKPKPPGKIQIPPGLQTKPVAAGNKVVPHPTTAPVSVPAVSKVTSPSPSSPPQSKEQAAKKISSVINKIVTSSSSSGDEANKKLIHKTEVTFPVAAAASAERVIPIKFEPEAEPETPSVASTKNRFPPRFDSFKRFDSASSIYSRQNSSDTDASCSLAAPPKPEPIRKSPREFLIPIKLEASGAVVTPREDVGVQSDTALGGAGSEDEFRIDSRLRSGRFGSGHNKFKRYSSLLSDSSGVEEDATSATGSRRGSGAVGNNNNGASGATVAHARSRSQGDEPDATGGQQQAQPAATFKRYRAKRPDLDRSDSFSSAEEDDEDFFEVFTADSLFSNLLDRVRNLTKRINREGSMGSMGNNWPSAIGGDATNFGLWNPSSSLRDLMQRAPSETRSFGSTTPGGFTVSTHRSFSRDPSLTMNLTSTGSGSNWRRSLSRDVSGDSDSSFGGNNTGRSYAGSSCSSKAGLPTELFETTSVRSLPVTLNRRSPSYLSQRSEPYGSDRESVTPTPQRPYGRTMSSTDYATNSPNLSRTLPFRRSLKSFNSQDHDYSVDSVVGAIRGLGQSLIDSPATFDPDSYLRQMRSDRAKSVGRELVVNREQNQNGNGLRDCNSMARMTSISETDGGGSGVTGGEAVETPPPQTNDHPGRLSVQDKMNNYTQYYNSLTGASPVKRFPSQIHAENGRGTSPSPNAIGLARLRPSTMFETMNGSSSSSSGPVGNNNMAMTTTSAGMTNGSDNVTPKLTTGIPKWPGVSIQQYRPLSISSFPSNENIGGKQIMGRASSVSRVVSPPPPPPPPPQTVATTTTPNSTNMNKKDISRATSVERITRFLERKSSVPREIQPVEVGQTQSRPFSPPVPVSSSSPVPDSRSSPTVRNTANNKSKFLQSLEKKWDKFTGNGQQQQQQPEMDKTRPMSPTILSGHRSPPPQQQQFEDDGDRGELSSTEISPDDNKISESVLLRRALSPEKKVKKFGSGTVNFMLGKFKRFEEVTPPPPAANKFQISAAGNLKPPVGSGSVGSRIGRRIQSAYAGAASDSVLTLSQRSNNFGNKSGILVNNGAEVGQDGGNSDMQQPDPEIIRSGEAAQEKRRSLRPQPVNSRALSPEMLNPVISRPLSPEMNSPSNSRPLSPPEFRPVNNRPLSPEVNYPSTTRPLSPPEFRPVNNRPLSPDPNHTYRPISPEIMNNRPLSPEVTTSTTRPLSLFVTTTIYNTDPIYSTPTLSSSSQIPRPNGLITTTLRSSSPIPTSQVKGQSRDLGIISPEPIPHPEREVITSKSMTSPPHVTINRSPSDNPILSPSMLSPNSDSVTTTTGDLDDSGSICSSSDVRNILDEEESVSDRIFRKSFYPRFHEKGIKTRSVSLNAATAARKGLHPNPQITNTPPPISNGHHHHHHHHHHRSNSQAKSVTPGGGKTVVTPSTSSAPAAETSPTITTTTTNGPAMSTLSTDNTTTTRAPSPHSLVINKYNPNPLFKELITDDFKSDIEKKTEYSRRVTSKLSKLLREIETDLNTCSLTKKDDDDEGDDEDEILGGTKNMTTNGVATTNVTSPPVENGTMDAKKPPVIGVGLKALAPTPPKNQNFKKYAGSKTTNLGGSINAVTNTTAKRNFFNREGSLQPEGEVTTKPMGFALLKPRASSVSRPMLNNTGNRTESASCNKRDNSDADNDRMDR